HLYDLCLSVPLCSFLSSVVKVFESRLPAALYDHRQPHGAVRSLYKDLFDIGGAAGAANHASIRILVHATVSGGVAQRAYKIRNQLFRECINNMSGRYHGSSASAARGAHKDRPCLRDQRIGQGEGSLRL